MLYRYLKRVFTASECLPLSLSLSLLYIGCPSFFLSLLLLPACLSLCLSLFLSVSHPSLYPLNATTFTTGIPYISTSTQTCRGIGLGNSLGHLPAGAFNGLSALRKL